MLAEQARGEAASSTQHVLMVTAAHAARMLVPKSEFCRQVPISPAPKYSHDKDYRGSCRCKIVYISFYKIMCFQCLSYGSLSFSCSKNSIPCSWIVSPCHSLGGKWCPNTSQWFTEATKPYVETWRRSLGAELVAA